MPEFLSYIIQVNICFAVLFICYMLFFRKSGFHTLNRFVLLGLSLISFVLPLLAFTNTPLVDLQISEAYTIDLSQINAEMMTSQALLDVSGTSSINIIFYIYLSVSTLLVLKFALSCISLYHLASGTEIKKQGGLKLFKADVQSVFSFFHFVFIPADHFENPDSTILEHERCHANKWHSLDLIFAELFAAISWFNPLVYAYKQNIRLNHEFEADRHILNSNKSNLPDYLNLLLAHCSQGQSINACNYFSKPSLKNRIEMMTQTKTNAFRSLIYVLLIPVVFILSAAFKSSEIPMRSYAIEHISSTPSNQEFIFPVQGHSINDISSYYKDIRSQFKEISRRVHGGIDIKAKIGTPIVASSSGSISIAKYDKGWGNYIVIDHADGYQTWYAHLNAFNVSEGEAVKSGDVIGYVGTTGRSTGPHLHFEIRKEGLRLDPMTMLVQ